MSADEHPTLPLPDPSARWVLQTDAAVPARRRKRRWPWLVALVVIVLLAVGAWFAGEFIARGIVERTVREQVVRNLDLPADQKIDVDVPGQVLPQLISGRLSEVSISSPNVSLQGVAADVTANAQGVDIRGGGWTSGTATVSFDQAQLQALLTAVPEFPAATVAIDAPDVAAEFTLQLFALKVPVGVSLTPRASGGDIVLTPARLRVGGVDVLASDLRQQFGPLASTVLRDWEVCIADRLPSAVELTEVAVDRDRVVASFGIDSAITQPGAAAQKGSCT